MTAAATSPVATSHEVTADAQLPPGEQYLELQSIRGLAALAVLFAHTLYFYPMPQAVGYYSILVFNSHASVVIFFVLSGFVLSRSLRFSPLFGKTTLVFYWKRLWRIYPAVIVATTLSLIYLLGFHFSEPKPYAAGSFAATFVRGRLTWKDVVLSYAALENYVIPPLWTIAVELVGSAFVPLAAVLIRRGGTPLAVLAVLAAFVVSFTIGMRTPYHIAIFLVDFFLGAALTTTQAPALFRRLGRFSPLFLCGCAAMLWLYRALFDRPDAGPLGNAVEALAAFGVIGAILYSSAGFSLLRRRWAIGLGDISFSVYLLHFPIMFIVAKLIAVSPIAGLAPLELALLLTAATVALTIPAAYATYRLVERPGVWLGKQTAKQIFK